MVARSQRSLALVLVAPVMVGAALAVPSGAQSARTPKVRLLTLSPAVPLVGESAVLAGKVPGPARRQVRLQVRRSDGTWRGIQRGITEQDRTFAFRLAPARTVARTVRVLAPAADDARKVRFRPVRYVGGTRTVRLVVPTEARAGEQMVMTAISSPPRPGQGVDLLLGDLVVDSAAQDGQGRAVLSIEAPPVGLHELRAESPAADGAAGATSAAEVLGTTAVLTGIPRVDIVTEDGQPITSKETYKRATLTVDPRGSGVPAYSQSARLRVRGNFTATVAAKLPYRIKLDDGAQLTGLPSNKDFVLLANYFDRTLLRNTLGFEISRRMGLPWSPRMVDVEVWLNGVLKGVYQLGEGIEVDGDRVDIDLADKDATDAGPGGFLLEADFNPDDDPSFTTTRGLQVFVKEPEDVNDDFRDGVAAQLQELEDRLYSPQLADPVGGYASLIDVGSFVDWYLAMELFKNVDAGFMNSVYLVRDTNGLLSMGPAWDFDIGAGNRVPWDGTLATGWFVRRNFYGGPDGVPSQILGPEGHWWIQLFEDPAFEAAVRERWSEVRAALIALPSYVAERRALIEEVALRNFTPEADGGAGFVQGPTDPDPEFAFKHWATWDESTDALVGWLTTRLAWMDDQLT